jgi:hypothetical protein
MEKTCAKIADTEAQEACSRDASLHGMLINLGGCKTYDSAQAASCRCVVEKKVLGKRRQVLSTFWAKYNRKKTAEDVDRVLAKYSNSPSSFARLLLKLVQKYKKSIKVSKSKYEDAMDELLRHETLVAGAQVGLLLLLLLLLLQNLWIRVDPTSILLWLKNFRMLVKREARMVRVRWLIWIKTLRTKCKVDV